MQIIVWLKKHKLIGGCTFLFVAGAIASIIYAPDWTGFGSDSTTNTERDSTSKVIKTIEVEQSGKTLWDWLGLGGTLAIPIAIYLFQRSENEQTDNISREEALLSYFKHISELLIDKKLKLLIDKKLKLLTDKESNKNECAVLDALLDSARACTLSLLRRMDKDGERKGRIISFLSDAELISELNLELADLSDANLMNVILNNAKLGYANLSNANLSLTDKRIINKINREFHQACKFDMQNVQMSDSQKAALKFIDNGIQLYCANLKEACLCNRFLPKANLSYANLSDANLSNANLSGADLSGANLSGANLSGVNLSGVILNKKTQIDAKWHTVWKIVNQGAKGQNLSGANLSDANLSDAILSGANLSDANLSDAILSGANLSDAILSGANLSDANLSGANLSGAKYTDPNTKSEACQYIRSEPSCATKFPSKFNPIAAKMVLIKDLNDFLNQ
ncbi:pentapeptide repeat-containing protein [Nostoc sp. UIC 10630]|uniref:pentapeptide repeat-containing protein n=1 Tax=Nostoc sp. UIC 10630 TaxID=2100146 RepID=UPI0013D01C47|nr:pentapeptide repeat-containing protein [Nostoc sp. UIC 10630]NEU84120.1 pentapeptide repeat-containing protein [Nostoc sp. UIC 10630]